MSLFLTSGDNTTDALTGIPIVLGLILITQDGRLLSTQATGEPPGGHNTRPGTDPNGPGNDDPGLPYGYETVPKTGPLF